MTDLRKKLDDLETAAFAAMMQAARDKDETEPALRRTFYFIEKLINEFDGVDGQEPEQIEPLLKGLEQ